MGQRTIYTYLNYFYGDGKKIIAFVINRSVKLSVTHTRLHYSAIDLRFKQGVNDWGNIIHLFTF